MSILPGGFASAMKFNPMTWYVGRLRDFLLLGNYGVSWYDLLVPLLTVLLFWASLAFFRRFSPHFEDFL
jgi:ABC-type polysaccharide/polyol phosphate export permease